MALRVCATTDGPRLSGGDSDAEVAAANRFLVHLAARAFSPATVRAYAVRPAELPAVLRWTGVEPGRSEIGGRVRLPGLAGPPAWPTGGHGDPADRAQGCFPGDDEPAGRCGARRAWNKRRWCCWHQLAYWRRSSAYASRVRPRWPTRNPANASRSTLLNIGSAGMRAADGVVVVIRHLRGRAETRRRGPPWPQQMEPHGKTAAPITPGHCPGQARAHPPAQQSLPSAEYERVATVLAVRALAHRLSGSAHAGARHGLSAAPWPSPLAPRTRRFIW